jgi:hypothetical protein
MDLSRVAARAAPQEKNIFGQGSPKHGGGKGGGGGSRGTGTRADDYARTIAIISAIVGAIALGYLLVGLYGGFWDHNHMKAMTLALRAREQLNVDTAFSVLRDSAIVFILSLLIVAARDETLGYLLVVGAAFFYFGLPAISSQVFSALGYKPSNLTIGLIDGFQSLAWPFFVPGVIWVLIDLIRRFRTAADAAAIQKANLKYGANVPKQKGTQVKQKFLGRCWELPYCKDNIRVKCPIFLKRKGPCWRYRTGCMCEEKIVLQAVIHKDWKSQTAEAQAALNGTNASAGLSMAQKVDRCRNCIIYNEHQRQKYKLLVTVAVIGVPVLIVGNFGLMHDAILNLLQVVEEFINRFSYNDSQRLTLAQDGILTWTLVGTLGLVLLTQVLRFIEYICFKLKI